MRGFVGLVRQINLRHFFERRLRTSLTLVGVAAGVALVVSIVTINTTLLSAVRASVRELAGSAELEVSAPDQTGLPGRTIAEVEGSPGVERAVPILHSATTFTHGDQEERMAIIGITPEFPSLFPREAGEMGKIGFTGGFGGRGGGLVLAGTAADVLGAAIGDRIQVETPRGNVPLRVTGKVTGGPIFHYHGGEFGVMLLPAAQQTFGRDDRIDSIYVVTDPEADLGDVTAGIEANVSAGAIVGPPGERGEGLERALNAITTLTSVSGTVAVFVAMFVVFNTMSMSLAERRREISMTFAFGASRTHVFGAFVAEAAVLGAIASGIGIAGGLVMAKLLVEPAMQGLRVLALNADGSLVVAPWHIGLGLTCGLVVAVVGAVIPARRIHRVSPIESLRPEASYEWKPGGAKWWSKPLSVVAGAGLLAISLVVLSYHPHESSNLGWLTNVGFLIGLAGVTFLLPPLVALGVRILRPILVSGFGPAARVSADALTTNPGRTTVTVGALVLTLGLVIGVGSALSSFENEFLRSAQIWYGAPLNVNAASYFSLNSDQALPYSAREPMEQVDGVAGVYPDRYRPIQIGGERVIMFVIPAVDVVRDGAELAPEGEVYRRQLAVDLGRDQIWVSQYTADRRDLEVGETLTIPTPEGEKGFEVAGLYNDLTPFESMYMGAGTYVDNWNETSVDRFEIALEPGASVAGVAEGLRRVIEAEGIPANVKTRDQLIGSVFTNVTSTFSVARGIQLAALIVAALTITNTMFIAVMERKWELGLQRAVGMARGQLGRSLLLEAGAIGIIGGTGAVLLGLAIGSLMLDDMSELFSFSIPYEVPWVLVGVAFVVGMGLAGLAGLYPTRTAVRTPIIEALRYE